LADLHHDFFEERDTLNQTYVVQKEVLDNAPLDAIVLAGDIYENSLRKSPYNMLARLFEDFSGPVICCLGNHEFLMKRVDDELKRMEDLYRPAKHNIHYLDVIGNYKLGKYTFVGNVLWYDGSLKCYPNQDMYKWADGCWADRFIKNFRFEECHERCVQQIKDNLAPRDNILITHCVPFRKLNAHPPTSQFNAYSGVDNIFRRLPGAKFVAAVCGHTHKRVVGEIEGVRGVNVGNDYGWPPLSGYVLELED